MAINLASNTANKNFISNILVLYVQVVQVDQLLEVVDLNIQTGIKKPGHFW
jgi:type IV secretory pathway VirB6-like protein